MAAVTVLILGPWADGISWTDVYQRAKSGGLRQVLRAQKALASALCLLLLDHHRDRVSAQEDKSFQLILYLKLKSVFRSSSPFSDDIPLEPSWRFHW